MDFNLSVSLDREHLTDSRSPASVLDAVLQNSGSTSVSPSPVASVQEERPARDSEASDKTMGPERLQPHIEERDSRDSAKKVVVGGGDSLDKIISTRISEVIGAVSRPPTILEEQPASPHIQLSLQPYSPPPAAVKPAAVLVPSPQKTLSPQLQANSNTVKSSGSGSKNRQSTDSVDFESMCKESKDVFPVLVSKTDQTETTRASQATAKLASSNSFPASLNSKENTEESDLKFVTAGTDDSLEDAWGGQSPTPHPNQDGSPRDLLFESSHFQASRDFAKPAAVSSTSKGRVPQFSLDPDVKVGKTWMQRQREKLNLRTPNRNSSSSIIASADQERVAARITPWQEQHVHDSLIEPIILGPVAPLSPCSADVTDYCPASPATVLPVEPVAPVLPSPQVQQEEVEEEVPDHGLVCDEPRSPDVQFVEADAEFCNIGSPNNDYQQLDHRPPRLSNALQPAVLPSLPAEQEEEQQQQTQEFLPDVRPTGLTAFTQGMDSLIAEFKTMGEDSLRREETVHTIVAEPTVETVLPETAAAAAIPKLQMPEVLARGRSPSLQHSARSRSTIVSIPLHSKPRAVRKPSAANSSRGLRHHAETVMQMDRSPFRPTENKQQLDAVRNSGTVRASHEALPHVSLESASLLSQVHEDMNKLRLSTEQMTARSTSHLRSSRLSHRAGPPRAGSPCPEVRAPLRVGRMSPRKESSAVAVSYIDDEEADRAKPLSARGRAAPYIERVSPRDSLDSPYTKLRQQPAIDLNFSQDGQSMPVRIEQLGVEISVDKSPSKAGARIVRVERIRESFPNVNGKQKYSKINLNFKFKYFYLLTCFLINFHVTGRYADRCHRQPRQRRSPPGSAEPLPRNRPPLARAVRPSR